MRLIDTYRSVNPKLENNEATFNGLKGETNDSRIDYIFTNDALYAQKATIERNKVLDNYPSDHYPVTATVYYRKL
jgi:endonuclease/exonuclease/phosphatase family metal-dependent hydrolase